VSSSAERLRSIYRHHGEKLRYLVVGAMNTAASYGLFWAAVRLFATPMERSTGFDPKTVALGLQWAVWVVAVILSTTTMKYLVFRSGGHLSGEILRAYFVYLPAQGLSSLILYSAMRFLGTSALVGQLFAVFVTTILSYFGHKHFTFRGSTVEGVIAP